MSTELAIASVTYVLKDLLNNGLIGNDVIETIGTDVKVTALPPDRIDVSESNEESQLNLFMYRVTPNQGWRNVGLPSHDGRGGRIANPPLALDLHYLLTAYGSGDLHTEILLGYGMQLLHETPVLIRDAIRRSLGTSTIADSDTLPQTLRKLSASELAEQIEQIKITPQVMSTEEISKLWSAFQTKYRPTTAYQVSVVLIESRRSTRSALPVRRDGHKIYAFPFQQPVIEKIKSQSRATADEPIIEGQPILAGYKLVLVGRNLRGEDTLVKVGGIEVTPSPGDVSNTQIILPIPAELSAGVQGVQVIHRMLMGEPPEPHRGVESSLAAFVLQPTLVIDSLSDVQHTGNNLYSGTVNVTVSPLVDDTQRVVLYLNEIPQTPANTPGADSVLAAYSFHASPVALLSPPAPAENLTIPISGVKAGTYLARIKVDGAESPLSTDAAGRYNQPQVTIS